MPSARQAMRWLFRGWLLWSTTTLTATAAAARQGVLWPAEDSDRTNNKPRRTCVLVDSFRHTVSRNGRPANFPNPHTPPRALAAHQLALRHLNSGNGRVIPEVAALADTCDIYFSVARYYDTEGSKAIGVDQVLEAMDNTNVTDDVCAFTGSFSSAVSVATALVTSLRGYAQFSAYSQTNQLEDTANYPLFGRTVPSNDQFAGPLLEFLTGILNVTHLTVVYSDKSATHNTFLGGFRDFLLQYPDLVVETVGFDNNADITAVVRAIQQTGHRYILGLIRFEQFEELIQEANKEGLLSAEYQWILASTSVAPLHNRIHENDSVLGRSGEGIMSFSILSAREGTARYDAFAQAFSELNNPEDIAYLTPLLPRHENAPDYNPSFQNETFLTGYITGARVYDAVIALGLAACAVNGTLNGASLFDSWTKTSFVGATGTVKFDGETGSRLPETALYVVANLVRRDVNETHFELLAKYPYVYDEGWQKEDDLVFSAGKVTAPAILPMIEVESNYIGWGWRSGGWVLAFAPIFASIYFAGFTWLKRETYVVRASQPIFLLLICFGVVLMASTIFPMSIDDELADGNTLDILCNMVPVLFHIGWCITFAALFAKTRRVNLVMNQPRFHRVTVKAKEMFAPMAVLLSSNLLILGLWIGLDPYRSERETTEFDSFNRPIVSEGKCRSDRGWAFTAPLLVVNLGVMLTAVQQLYKARKISTDFAETDWVARALHSILVVSLVGIPVIVLVEDDPTTHFFVTSAIIFVICASLVGFIFVPKMLQKSLETGNTLEDAGCSNRSIGQNQSIQFGLRVLENPGLLKCLEDEMEKLRAENGDLKRQLLEAKADESTGKS